jgi:hypothetical protein
MTSQLNVDTIVDKAGSGGTNVKVKGSNSTYVDGTTTQNLISGVVKVFYGVDMYDGANNIEGSFNVSTFTDTGTGTLNANYTNNMSNQNYVPAGMSTDGNIMSTANAVSEGNSSKQTNLFKGRIRTNAAALQDAYHYNHIVGDLA